MSWKKWVTVATLVALVGGIVGVLRMQPGEAAVGDTHEMTIPAAAFIPTTDDWDYSNNGYYLSAVGSSANFSAPLSFPVDLGHVRITKLIFWAYDNGPADVCLTLYRAQLRTGSDVQMGQKCSGAASATDPRRFATSKISPRTATASKVPYLWLTIPAGDYYFYGVTIQWKEI